MNAETLFILIIGIIIVDFIVDKWLDLLNARHFDDEIPEELKDVYDEKEYVKSQEYKRENHRFSLVSSSFSLLVTLAFFLFEGFAWLDGVSRELGNSEITVALIFFGIILIGSEIIQLPFSYYRNFIIEEKYGFNKSTPKLFLSDKLKSWFLTIVIGGGLLSLIMLIYQYTGDFFWIVAWITIGLFTIFMTLFYSSLVVPLFNKQTPLEEGTLKEAIWQFAKKVNFTLDNVYVIDGSKRSTKANAYFAGFGKKKRIVLYDTLLKDLSTEEVVSVLAHEVGHYKKKHVLANMIMSLLLTGVTLYIFSLFVDNQILSEALSVSTPSFHIGLITFGILYSPFSEVTGILMHYISRQFEYQADNYAKNEYGGTPLISSLKKLSRNNLSNLTPHKATVIVHYSHPTLLQRVRNLGK